MELERSWEEKEEAKWVSKAKYSRRQSGRPGRSGRPRRSTVGGKVGSLTLVLGLFFLVFFFFLPVAIAVRSSNGPSCCCCCCWGGNILFDHLNDIVA